jgi:hypothetical protein
MTRFVVGDDRSQSTLFPERLTARWTAGFWPLVYVREDEGKPMLFKRFRRAVEPSPSKWKRIEETPIPLSLGRIWLVDKDGYITRAMAFTWPILKRREPRKYRFWMSREPHAREPAAEAIAALRALRTK